ncbi:MAG: HD-GYP domain-containing protein, partial [Spirochaetales bacterium]|nr:HD-GYP domain-containing protein [Spirochaetales bacterium]
ALRDPVGGHSWSGTIRLHCKDTSSVLTKTTIIPYRPKQMSNAEPAAWVAFFDDVTEERNGFLKGLFTSLLEASKLKDNDTGKHIERVNYYAELMAREMYRVGAWPEVDVDFVENIGFLAAMHDVGKIGTPDDILNKKGPLDEFEWNIMKEHTINGAFILSSYPNPMAKQIAQSHHEWWNGTGYPYSLFGDLIPLPARIVAIADVYDALRMRRSYKEPFDHARASLMILADSGQHFDPDLVGVFKTIEDNFSTIYSEYTDEITG